jgi:hypothetical protein
MKVCPRCGRFYPDSAWTCPKDGYPVQVAPVEDLVDPVPTFTQDIFGKARHAARRLALYGAPLRRCPCGENMRAVSLIERREGRFGLKTGSCLNYRCRFCPDGVAIESRFSMAVMIWSILLYAALGTVSLALAVVGVVGVLTGEPGIGWGAVLLVSGMGLFAWFVVKEPVLKLRRALKNRRDYPEAR